MNSDTVDGSAADSPAAADIINQIEAINELEIKFMDIIDRFPQSAARQMAVQRFMECTFWLAESLGDNP